MPIATVTKDTERKDLKSCPPDGFVVIKRMAYGQKLYRQALLGKATIHTQRGSKDVAAEMELINEKVTLYEFKHCIVDHNLTDAEGRKLDFNKPEDVKSLTGRVGEEINTYIGELNNFEDDEELEK